MSKSDPASENAGATCVAPAQVLRRILAGDAGLRVQLLAALKAAPPAADPQAASCLAKGLLLHTLADLQDFRGLALALAAFDPSSPVDQR